MKTQKYLINHGEFGAGPINGSGMRMGRAKELARPLSGLTYGAGGTGLQKVGSTLFPNDCLQCDMRTQLTWSNNADENPNVS